MEEKKPSWWEKSLKSVGNFAKKSANSITNVVKTGVDKTSRACDYLGDQVMNRGKCYMCKGNADCKFPCNHELCSNCLKFYIDSFGESISELQSIPCYICQEPIPLEILHNHSVGIEESKVLEIQNIRPPPEQPKAPETTIQRNPENRLSQEKFLKQCPYCSESLMVSGDSKDERCPDEDCKKRFCPQCNQDDHPDRNCISETPSRIILPEYPQCPGCLTEYIRTEGCNFLRCENSCPKNTCYCLLCGRHIRRTDYFSHYSKSGPYGNVCNMSG